MAFLRLNLGCGSKKYPGYLNVDVMPECTPDMLVDLETTPWPWEENTVDEIRLEHVLEHLGETTKAYLAIWKEMWRISKPGALIDITVPHWNHESQYHDPTHVRAVTPIGIAMFDQTRNAADKPETKLGLALGIDIQLKGEDVEFFYAPKMVQALREGSMSREDVKYREEHLNNICEYIRMKAYVVKPARGIAPSSS